jgi:lysophospholipase L1-like esterase
MMNRVAPAALLVTFACVACSADPGAAGGVDPVAGAHSITQAVAPLWTGTWSVSPQGASGSFNQQTLRQIVHTSISGSAARIQISNLFGSQPLQISDVHIAERSSGSSITAGTDHLVTFGGSGSVTVGVGAVAISDTISFPVTAFTDVAISFYLPQASGSATYHSVGEQTNYIASGDVAGNASLSSPSTTGSYYFLTNLDVQNTSSLGAVVTLGASITDGVGSASNANRRWPNDLAVRLMNSGRLVGVLNQGISGNRLLSDGSGPSALNRFSRDVLAQPGVKWVIFSDDPINDLGASSNRPTGDQLISGLTQLITSAHQAGIKFLCSTLTPFEGAGYWTSQGETGREQVNSFIRSSSSGCDGVVDQDLATHDPSAPTKFLPAYDSGDHLHPNDAGLQAIANAVQLSWFSGPVTGASSPLTINKNYEIMSVNSGSCLDLPNGSSAEGVAYQQHTCNQSNAQRFQLWGGPNGTYYIGNIGDWKCLDASNGSSLQQKSCVWNSTQQFYIEEVSSGQKRLRSVTANKCVDITGGRTADGTAAILWGCSGSSNQSWVLRGITGDLRHVTANMCLHPSGDATVPGDNTAAVLEHDCSAIDRNRYTLRNDGNLQQVSSGECLNPFTGVAKSGTAAVFFNSSSCGNPGNAFVQLPSGAMLHKRSGLCLQRENGTTNDGEPIIFGTSCVPFSLDP